MRVYRWKEHGRNTTYHTTLPVSSPGTWAASPHQLKECGAGVQLEGVWTQHYTQHLPLTRHIGSVPQQLEERGEGLRLEGARARGNGSGQTVQQQVPHM